MKGSIKSGGAEMLGRLEDRAVKYVRNLSPAVAFATALEAEFILASSWAAKQEKMLQSGITREIFQIADDDFKRMRQARSMVPPDGRVDLEALHLILRTLDDLEPDLSWKVAFAVVLRTGIRCLLPDGVAPGNVESSLTGVHL
jgi:hypothetical protein